MTESSDHAAAGGNHGRFGTLRIRGNTRGAGIGLVGLPLVIVAAAAGWLLAGPPDDVTAVVPPPCPSAVSADGGTGDGIITRPGEPGVLVPMPLPQPRGPVSARVCGYRASGAAVAAGVAAGSGGGYALDRQVVLDPARTAALAGRLNSPGGRPVDRAGTGTASACPPGENPAVLVFRYTEGPVAVVEVPGGPCAVVTTPARIERDRADVVRLVTEALA